MTERILHVTNHLGKNRQDKKAKRSLQILLDRRRKMMEYLRRTDYHYYKWILQTYNLPDNVTTDAHQKTDFHLRFNKSLSAKKK